tara:strand:+ start:1086 stop:1481 length:396 start_codon:yes stop_codon:yes gene_type:complete
MVTLKEVLETVSYVCKVSLTQMRSKKRYRLFSEARGLYFLFARDYTDCGVQEIAKYINRHHATCIHYSKITPQLLKYDKKYRITYGDIQGKLNKIKNLDNEANDDKLKQIDFQIAELLKEKNRIVSTKKDT